MRNAVLLLGAMTLIIWGCSRPSPEAEASRVPYLHEPAPSWVDSVLGTWSLEQKAGQLLLWEGTAADSSFARRAMSLAQQGYLGGMSARGFALQDYLDLVDSLQTSAEVPLFIAAHSSLLLNDQFSGTAPLPGMEVVYAAGDDSLHHYLQQLFARQARFLGVNMVFSTMPNALSGANWNQFAYDRIPLLNRHRVITAIDEFDDYYPHLADTAALLNELLATPRDWVSQGLGGLTVPPQVGGSCGSKNAHLHTFINEKLGYDGLIWGTLSGKENLLCLLQAGYDAFRIQNHPEQWRRRIASLVASGQITEAELDRKVRKVLRARSWVHNGIDQRIDRHRPTRHTPMQASLLAARSRERDIPYADAPLREHFSPRMWKLFKEDMERRAITLLNASPRRFPLPATAVTLFDFGDQPSVHLQNRLRDYLPLRYRHGQSNAKEGYDIPPSVGERVVVVLGATALHKDRDHAFMQWLAEHQAMVVNFGGPTKIAALDTTGLTLIQTFGRSRHTEESVAEVLVGARGVTGRLPYAINEQLPRYAGEDYDPIRLGYSQPEEVGIKGEELVSIDAIVSRAIRKRAMPGCQVLVAHRGRIIYHKAFGSHTYGGPSVRERDVYDLASLTKTMATTLGIMHLYEKGDIALKDRVRDHLPELAAGNLAHITIERLLTHRSGIQPHMPVIPYLLHRGKDNAACDSFFCAQPSEKYRIPVAEGFYFNESYQDSIWNDLNDVKVRYGQRYQYSDVNFVLLQKILERKTGQTLDEWLTQNIYDPLALERTTFRPLDKLPGEEIVPTEKDVKWRRQLVHGYVHDETAGLLGGVAGHAGLFSNARELAVLAQLLLNEGQYAGKQFFAPETVRLFRSSGHGNHRGLGFDKPYASNRGSRAADVSDQTFGHTGFTGTCFWIDPDRELVFIFLANRVYPTARNRRFFRMKVRAQVHQEIYDALGSFPTGWPSLPDVDLAPPPLLVQRSNPS